MSPAITENNFIDHFLTNYALNTPMNQAYVADMVAPRVTVPGKKFKYKQYNMLTRKVKSAEWPRRAEPQVIRDSFSWVNSETIRRGLGMEYDEEDLREHVGPRGIREDYTLKTRDAVMLQREIELATYMETSGNFTNSGTPSTLWDAAGGTPISDIMDQISTVTLESRGLVPNTLLMGAQVFNKLRNNAEVRTWLERHSMSALTVDGLSQMTGGLRVVVGNAVKDTAAEDTSNTVTDAWVWGPDAWLLHVSPSTAPTNGELTWGSTFFQQGQEGVVEELYDERKKVWTIRYGHEYKFLRVYNEAAYFFESVLT